MAYVQDFSNEEDQKAKEAPGSDGQLLSEPSSALDAGPSSGGSGAPSGQTRGSGYMNLSEYAKANEGSSADIAGKVVEPVRKATQEARDAGSAYQSALSGISGTQQNPDFLKAVQDTPQKLAEKSWQDLFKSQTAGYSGPNSEADVGGYQDLVSKYQKAQQAQTDLNNPGNLTAAVKSAYGTPQYTQGENALDAFLAGSGAGAGVLNQARQDYKPASTQAELAGIQKQASDKIAGAKSQSQETARAANQAVADRQKGFEDLFTSYGATPGDRASQEQIDSYKGILGLLGQQSKFDFTPTPKAPEPASIAQQPIMASVAPTPVTSAARAPSALNQLAPGSTTVTKPQLGQASIGGTSNMKVAQSGNKSDLSKARGITAVDLKKLFGI